jgi:hypothetical protein
MILLDITPVSTYNLTIDEAGPYMVGATYTLRVTPRNYTDVAVTDWNGTVNLVAPVGIALGASSHAFSGSEASWTTTIVASTGGALSIVSKDGYFYLDVTDAYSFSFTWPTFTLVLTKGWNFVTVPGVGFGYSARTLGLAKFDTIASWDPATQGYPKTYVVGVTPPGGDFPILPNTGYWINAGPATETIVLNGTIPIGPQTRTVTIPGGTGWINLAFNTMNATWKASNITTMFSGATITAIAWYNSVSKQYKTYVPGVPPSDYTLIPGVAYWVSVNGGGTFTYTP